ncbi:MAG: hypothetical protein NPIRA02_31290 [Nitrospirales bacterium]|nr:MAG: hypothetical protein NPIRA02_31290 [Nitrospirales bacterium]
MKVVSLLIAVCGCIFSACLASSPDALEGQEREASMAFGSIDVTEVGPNPRQFPARVRFVDVVHVATQQQIRIKVNPRLQTFFVSLRPGTYEMVRVQINEGPFMAESYLHARFDIPAGMVTHLGRWQFAVETPRTQRMVSLTISEENWNWDEVLEHNPGMEGKVIINSFPQLMDSRDRLYAVAPNPKLKYFYRQ